VARNQPRPVEIGPDGRKLLLPDAQQIDALAAGDLDGRNPALFVGDGAQRTGRGQAAPHPRHHRIGAVLLDVGMHPLVDETRLRVVAITVRPGAQQIVIERRAAFLAAVRGLPLQRRAHGRDRPEPLRQDGAAHGVVSEIGARARRRVLAMRRRLAAAMREDRLDNGSALPAGGRRLGARAHRRSSSAARPPSAAASNILRGFDKPSPRASLRARRGKSDAILYGRCHISARLRICA